MEIRSFSFRRCRDTLRAAPHAILAWRFAVFYVSLLVLPPESVLGGGCTATPTPRFCSSPLGVPALIDEAVFGAYTVAGSRYGQSGGILGKTSWESSHESYPDQGRIEPHVRKLSRRDSWRRTFLKLRVAYVAQHVLNGFPPNCKSRPPANAICAVPACSHAKEKGNGQHLTEKAFRKILDDLPWSPARVVLSGIGEPLMNPDFFSLVDILAERGIKCEFFTNGTLLTESRRQAILSRSNIDTVNISCDGSRKDTFESLRVGANFETWKELVREFLLRSKRQRGRTLDIGMNVVVSKQNRHEIGDILRLAAEMGFGNVYVIDLIPVDDIATSMYLSDAELSAVHQELVELAADSG